MHTKTRLARVFLFAAERPLTALVILVVGTIFCGAGLPRLSLDTSQESLIQQDHPDNLYYEQFAAEFGSDFITLIFLEADNVFTPARLAAIADTTEAVKNSDRAIDAQSLATAFTIESGGGMMGYVPLYAAPPDTMVESDLIRQRALKNPLIVDALVSKSGDTAVIVATFDADWEGEKAKIVFDAVEEAMAPARDAFDNVFQLGPARFITDTENAITADIKIIGAVSAVILLLMLFVIMKSTAAVITPVLIGVFSLIWTLGLMGWIGLPITLLSTALPALVFVVGSTESTHLVAAYYRAVNRGASSPVSALEHMADDVGLASFVTAITTTLGFGIGGLWAVDLVRFSTAALAMGMALNFVATIFVLPLALAKTPLGRITARRDQALPLKNLSVRLASISTKLSRPVTLGLLAAILAGAGGCIWAALNARPSADPISLLNSKHPLVQAVERAHDRVAGMQVAFLVIESLEEDSFLDVRFLNMLAKSEGLIENSSNFDVAFSLNDHMSYAHASARTDEFLDRNYEHYTQFDLDEYAFIFPREATKHFISSDARRAVITIRHNVFESAELGELVAQLKSDVSDIMGAGFSVEVTGKSIILNRAADNLVRNLIFSFGVLVIAVSVTIAVAFRSARLGFLSVAPNILPAAVVFAMMPIAGIPLNPGTALAALVALGVAVDGTIHLINAYLKRMEQGDSIDEAVQQSVAIEVLPVVATSIGLAGAFFTLGVSEFGAVGQFGALCATAILLALPIDLLFTPALLRVFGAARKPIV